VATSSDFFITGDHEAGKALVASALQSQGFTVTSTPKGGLLAKRGSTAATIWLGAMAGKNFQVTFNVEFFVDAEGKLVARLTRDMASGALKGGAIGASKTNTAFVETAGAIGAALTNSGAFAGNVNHG
jgi:hypothetical protein